jgi:N-acyl-D-aspartate/D-glutamate deacylase
MSFDLLVKGGTIVDGSGLPRYGGDIGIREGRIVEIGRLGGEARQTVAADGLVVAPGIIDAHTHYDPQLTFEPLGTSSVWHGVTTVVTGNCGMTLAPCRPRDRDYLVGMFGKVEGMSREVLEAALPWSWESFPEFLDTLDRRLGINAMVFVGHHALRRYVLGEAANARAATEDEIRRMADLLREALAAGAAGFSTGRVSVHVDGDDRPAPARAAPDSELYALAATLAERNLGAIEIVQDATRMAGQRPGWVWEDEAGRAFLATLTRASGNRPVLANGLVNPPDPDDRDRLQRAFQFQSEVAEQGGRVLAQVRNQPSERAFNFGAGPTLETLPVTSLDRLPTWRAVLALPAAERLGRLRDADTRARMREEVDHPSFDPARGRMLPPPRWERISVAKVARPEHRRYEGRGVVEIAGAEGRHLADVMLDLVVAEELATGFFLSDRCDEALYAEVLRNPFTVVGTSDGGAHLERDDRSDWSSYFLHYWIGQKEILSLEQGIRRITFFPASVLGLHDRGLLRPGYAADLFLFDPQAIRPVSKRQVADFPAGGVRYVTEAAGVHQVIVNGQVLVDAGEHTGAYPGKVLRPALQSYRGA